MQFLQYLTFEVITVGLLYRVDHNVIFEELKTMDKNTSSLSTVLEKDSMLVS
jgi:hypothetical protein